MTDTTRTHRCIDCAQRVEHTPQEICPSCGRCKDHCHGATDVPPSGQAQLELAGMHRPMKAIGEI